VDVFLESPVPSILAGILLLAVWAVVFVNLRRGWVLIAMALTLLAALGGVVLERFVVTDRERIEATLDQIADVLEAQGLEANRPEFVLPAVLQYVSPRAVKTRRLAETNCRLVEILQAKVINVEVEFNRLTSPPTAEAHFDAKIVARGRNGLIQEQFYPLDFFVQLRYENGRWLVGDKVHWELQRL